MTFIYTILIHFYYLIVLAVSLFSHKARLWVRGRLGWKKRLEEWCVPGDPIIWIHAASLGEFEQGRPLIDIIKSNHPRYRLLLTFYSPSGFEVRKNYPGADLVMYLPLDTPYNARRFVNLVNPAAAVFIKYEFWRFYLSQLHAKKHPVYLISAIFRSGQPFFRWYGAWFRKNLSFIDFFFVQDEPSALLLKTAGITRCIVCGDTRFDRVAAVAASAREVDLARIFSQSHFCIVAGSTWPADEDILIRYINQSSHETRFIIAPHEITGIHLKQLKSGISRSHILYSKASADTVQEYQVLIIDNIGMLSSLYRYGHVAYIGGGFGKGIHNILEAAAFGIPVVFGPNYRKFREACELLSLGGGFTIQNAKEFFSILELLENYPGKYEKSASTAGSYVQDHTGATVIIADHLFANLSRLSSGTDS
jgi:3-deoxy-D-manno-octulosonic-acid transferase